jgi:hypothetical protein
MKLDEESGASTLQTKLQEWKFFDSGWLASSKLYLQKRVGTRKEWGGMVLENKVFFVFLIKIYVNFK